MSCGSDSSSSENFKAQLVGEWETDCYEISLSDSTRYAWSILSTGEFTMNEIRYSQSGCKDEAVSAIYKGEGSYQLNFLKEGETTFNSIAFQYEKFSVTPKSNEFVDRFNQNGFCDVEEWVLSQEESVFGKTCQLENDTLVFPSSQKSFQDIVDVDGDLMWLGEKEVHTWIRTCLVNWMRRRFIRGFKIILLKTFDRLSI